jgi:hypothetical protein
MNLSITFPLLLAASAFAQSDDPRVRLRALSQQQIIPAFIEYEAPSPFFRAHTVEGKPPAPEFYHPQNGSERSLAEIKFHLNPVGMWVGEGKSVHSKSPTWEELKSAATRLPSEQLVDRELKEETIDGKKVLILDYRSLLGSGAPWPCFYVSRIWIPIDEDVVIEGMIVCSTLEARTALRGALAKMRIHRYHQLK